MNEKSKAALDICRRILRLESIATRNANREMRLQDDISNLCSDVARSSGTSADAEIIEMARVLTYKNGCRVRARFRAMRATSDIAFETNALDALTRDVPLVASMSISTSEKPSEAVVKAFRGTSMDGTWRAATGNLIAAIKEVRTEMGLNLRDSKELCDRWRDKGLLTL